MSVVGQLSQTPPAQLVAHGSGELALATAAGVVEAFAAGGFSSARFGERHAEATRRSMTARDAARDSSIAPS